MNNIKVLQLTNGDQVVCFLTEKDDYYEMKNAFKPVMDVDPATGRPQFGLMPLIPISDDDVFKIKKEHVAIVATPLKEIANEFNAKYGNGIVTPNLKITQ